MTGHNYDKSIGGNQWYNAQKKNITRGDARESIPGPMLGENQKS